MIEITDLISVEMDNKLHLANVYELQIIVWFKLQFTNDIYKMQSKRKLLKTIHSK